MKNMKTIRFLFLFVVILSSCGVPQVGKTAPTPSVTKTLPSPVVDITHAPDARTAADNFLAAWKAGDYTKMYATLTPVTQDSITLEDFTNRYKDAAKNLTLRDMDYQVQSVLTNPTNAQASYGVNFKTSLLGDISRNMSMNLSLVNGEWKIQWEDGMILPELQGGNHLALDVKNPMRANIYDRNGNALAAQNEAVSLGIVPSQIGDGQEGKLVNLLAQVLGKSPLEIRALYADNQGANWYVPIGEALAQDVQEHYNALTGLGGLVMNSFTSRYYYNEGIAPHVTGYVQYIPKEQLDQFKQMGYRGDEKVGMSGLEKWGEKYLAGKGSAALYVVGPNGDIITRLGQTEAVPSQAVYSTIDSDLQEQVQRIMGGFKGAIVVMERDTGRVLAMASSPGFDPNAFEPSNYNSSSLLQQALNPDTVPLVNRAAQGGGYPLGSVYKIITMAAALESGLYTPQTIYDCQYDFKELGENAIKYDWTKDHNAKPSGKLTLPEGLMRSCNPYFYHIGLDLYRQKGPKYIADLARGFGLGSATGIEQLAESTGQVMDPESEEEAVDSAIGQGRLLVTPLQVVDFVAAVGNGGTLYRPQVVEKIVSPDGTETYSFKPQVRGKLPVSPENLKVIQDAMRAVVVNERGTAYYSFIGNDFSVHGKTGTAQTSDPQHPHAWFAGYTDSPREDKPNIAVVVLAENAGEGSQIAAPMFRRVMELYYDGKPERLFPWESSYWVTETPTSLYTRTPRSTSTETPNPETTPTPIQ